ncbi:MAG: hypothetical protein JJE50_15225 [Actinomycetales bacterium]|nr:hypothetical protein [Actinomycetales bacterium]
MRDLLVDHAPPVQADAARRVAATEDAMMTDDDEPAQMAYAQYGERVAVHGARVRPGWFAQQQLPPSLAGRRTAGSPGPSTGSCRSAPTGESWRRANRSGTTTVWRADGAGPRRRRPPTSL